MGTWPPFGRTACVSDQFSCQNNRSRFFKYKLAEKTNVRTNPHLVCGGEENPRGGLNTHSASGTQRKFMWVLTGSPLISATALRFNQQHLGVSSIDTDNLKGLQIAASVGVEKSSGASRPHIHPPQSERGGGRQGERDRERNRDRKRERARAA